MVQISKMYSFPEETYKIFKCKLKPSFWTPEMSALPLDITFYIYIGICLKLKKGHTILVPFYFKI